MSIFEILGVWPLLKVFFEGIASVNWGDRGDRSLIYGTLSVLTVHFEGSCRYVSELNNRYGIDQSCHAVSVSIPRRGVVGVLFVYQPSH